MPDTDGSAAPRSRFTVHGDESVSQPTPPGRHVQIGTPLSLAFREPDLSQRVPDLRAPERLPKPWQAKPFTPLPSRLARNRVFKGRAQDNIHLAYNRLRTQMLKRLEANNWKTVAVMGPTKGAGSTVTAINLAISIARDFSYNVLLVELDLIEPSFQRILGFDQRLGLADHLLYDVPIADILLNPGIEQLDLIPAGSPVTNSSELISSPQMIRFVKEVKEGGGYRVVLFDLPPVLGADDAMVFARFADCALLVVEEGETRIREVRQALDYLEPTELLGVVLNRSLHVESDR